MDNKELALELTKLVFSRGVSFEEPLSTEGYADVIASIYKRIEQALEPQQPKREPLEFA